MQVAATGWPLAFLDSFAGAFLRFEGFRLQLDGAK